MRDRSAGPMGGGTAQSPRRVGTTGVEDILEVTTKRGTKVIGIVGNIPDDCQIGAGTSAILREKGGNSEKGVILRVKVEVNLSVEITKGGHFLPEVGDPPGGANTGADLTENIMRTSSEVSVTLKPGQTIWRSRGRSAT